MSRSDKQLKILIVEDDEIDRERLKLALANIGLKDAELREAHNSREAIQAIADLRPSLVFLDLALDAGDRRGESGARVLRTLRQAAPETAVVIITTLPDDRIIPELQQDGFQRYLVKPITDEKIALSVRGLAARFDLRLIDPSPPLPQAVEAQVSQVAQWDIQVLIQGETGVGKELVARAVHQRGHRKLLPFVAVQLDAIHPDRWEAEIFGWKRDSFTGANRDHKGLIEQAHGGTLFLDEIGRLPLDLQSKLLRSLETKQVRALGATRDEEVDFRLVAATSSPDLRKDVQAGRFLPDLYYRLSGWVIRVPPLRERLDDLDRIVPIIVREFEKKYEFRNKTYDLAPGVMDRLRAQRWPGNVRELRMVLERAIILAAAEQGEAGQGTIFIRADDIRLDVELPQPAAGDPGMGVGLSRHATLDENYRLMARNQIQLLENEGRNWQDIIRVLGISRATYFRIKAGGPERP